MLEYPEQSDRPTERVVPGTNEALNAEERLKQDFGRCSGITDDQLQEAETFAELAARGSNLMEAEQWRNVLRDAGDFRQDFELLERMWQAGWVTAAGTLALYYRNEVGAPIFDDPDFVRSYAYQLIVFSLQEQAEAEALAVDLLSSNRNCCVVGAL